ncbi:DUF4232 domain-containing protein [Streptomyces sp. HNM0574]|uniref:DUF4232 domain-containing protein n=1 Tax=Streptomyces sp. HNM0574 TaxID=2714954 RepID=UPI00146DCEA6|nr:DUF4232 domain-containing protein [Streptomyces sp. HNM0574]NLU69943.1 DUF4232 domain-containing protein [Streptomyces sp. HNM0574]
MARHSARSALIALTAGTALAVTGCGADTVAPQGGDAPSDARSSAVEGPPAEDADAPDKQHAPDDGQSAPGSPWCATDDLAPSLRPLESAAGNRYSALVLTNTSDTACRTQGWPGLQLTDAAGEALPTDAVRDRSRTPEQLTLEPGGNAWSRLHWTVVPSEGDPSDGCPDPAGLKVTPPDARTPSATKWDQGTVCGTGEVDVLPLGTGSGPDH